MEKNTVGSFPNFDLIIWKSHSSLSVAFVTKSWIHLTDILKWDERVQILSALAPRFDKPCDILHVHIFVEIVYEYNMNRRRVIHPWKSTASEGGEICVPFRACRFGSFSNDRSIFPYWPRCKHPFWRIPSTYRTPRCVEPSAASFQIRIFLFI